MDFSVFESVLSRDQMKKKVAMRDYTTIRIGGEADVLLPKNAQQLAKTVLLCRENGIPYVVLGNGSNVVVSDSGMEEAVILTSRMEDEIRFEGTFVTASAGVKLSHLAKLCMERSLEGLSFAYGIPATVGGAVYMNAGAYGGALSDVIEEVTALDPHGNVVHLAKKDCGLDYRKSVFQKNGFAVLGVRLSLRPGNREEIAEEMKKNMESRRTKQPLQYPSAGSVFKRPKEGFAGKLIEEAGLKGFAVGGAEVSTLHAGFIINKNSATAKDFDALVEEIQKRVYQVSGVMLECEVERLGRKD